MNQNNNNLAEHFLAPDPKEHTQEMIYALEIRGRGWVNIIPGTLDLAISDSTPEVEFEAIVASCEPNAGTTVSGILSDITGLKSVEAE